MGGILRRRERRRKLPAYSTFLSLPFPTLERRRGKDFFSPLGPISGDNKKEGEVPLQIIQHLFSQTEGEKKRKERSKTGLSNGKKPERLHDKRGSLPYLLPPPPPSRKRKSEKKRGEGRGESFHVPRTSGSPRKSFSIRCRPRGGKKKKRKRRGPQELWTEPAFPAACNWATLEEGEKGRERKKENLDGSARTPPCTVLHLRRAGRKKNKGKRRGLRRNFPPRSKNEKEERKKE